MSEFDHRSNIVGYIDRLAVFHAEKGQGKVVASVLHGIASSIAAGLDVEGGRREVAGPVHHIISQCISAMRPGLSVPDVLAQDRTADVARVRHAAVWVAKRRLGWDDERLGECFLRERKTISGSLKRAEALRDHDADFKAVTDRIGTIGLRCEHCFASLDNTV